MPRPTRDNPAPFTVTAGSLLAFVGLAMRAGRDVEGALAHEGVAARGLEDPDYRLDQDVFNRVVAALASDDAAFGLHAAELADPKSLPIVGYLATRSENLGQALARFGRFSRLMHDAGRFDFEVEDWLLHVYPGCRGLVDAPPAQVAEYATALVVQIISEACGRKLPVRRVAFRHGRPADTSEHVRILGCEPEFGAAEGVLTLPAGVMGWPLASADSGLADLLERYAAEAVQRIPQEWDLVTTLEEIIAARLQDGPPSLKDAASAVGLSERTLQRRLRDRETSLDLLIDDVRRRLAERCVGDTELRLSEVAYLLGYAEVSNFHRAFRRWFNDSPGEYRTRRLNGA